VSLSEREATDNQNTSDFQLDATELRRLIIGMNVAYARGENIWNMHGARLILQSKPLL